MKNNIKKNKWHLKKGTVIVCLWNAFLLLSIVFYVKFIIPSQASYIINNPYTMDSVWNKEGNGWHNDVLLYTLFSSNTVYMSPDSWYIDYVAAFAENVVADKKIDAIIDEDEVDKDSYVCLEHMIAVQNSTLFDEQVIETIADRSSDGAAFLYIDEDSIEELPNGIVLFHDECGNVYLKGYENEESR